MALGPTHFRWRSDVEGVVRRIERRFPGVRCNTYIGHPWPGWDGQSLDVWGRDGRGHPIDLMTGHHVLQFLRDMPDEPWIRHHIYLQSLWTSFGGYTRWVPLDHSGRLRHVHVTYW